MVLVFLPGPAPPPAAPEPPGPPPLPPPEYGPGDVPQEDRHALLARALPTWGCFTITQREPGKAAGRWGGFQARCRFHKKNDVTDCKKLSLSSGPTQEDQDNALHRLVAWCMRAPHHQRQRTHLLDFKPVDQCPPVEYLMLNPVTEAPEASTVLSDMQLDLEAGSSSSSSSSTSTSSD